MARRPLPSALSQLRQRQCDAVLVSRMAGTYGGGEYRLATETAIPSHNHPEGIKGAVVAARCIFHLKNGKDKDFIRQEILDKEYPFWAGKSYEEIKPAYSFDSTCQGSLGPAIISFLASKDYVDCLRLAISLGGDADTLAAIAGPMAYAFYREMPEPLVYQALKKLPEWMQKTNEEFDERCGIE